MTSAAPQKFLGGTSVGPHSGTVPPVDKRGMQSASANGGVGAQLAHSILATTKGIHMLQSMAHMVELRYICSARVEEDGEYGEIRAATQ